MTSASSLAFPGSRTLAAWWRQLAPHRPKTLGVGYLFVHRVEASACRMSPRPLDPLLLLVLEGVAIDQQRAAGSSAAHVERLQRLVRLDAPVLARLLQSLMDLHLLKTQPDEPRRTLVITEAGREALRTRHLLGHHWRRERFSFVEDFDPKGQRRASPHFLHVGEAPASSWLVENGAGFEVAWLQDCLVQSAEWKKTFSFPTDVTAIATAAPGEAVPWNQVVLDRTERLLVALCRTSAVEEMVLGFAARSEGWLLSSANPILLVPTSAHLFAEPDDADAGPWQYAWQTWCQSRGLAAEEASACTLSLAGERLRVQAPASLFAALQTLKSDVFKGDTWLTAGNGYLRRAACVALESQ